MLLAQHSSDQWDMVHRLSQLRDLDAIPEYKVSVMGNGIHHLYCIPVSVDSVHGRGTYLVEGGPLFHLRNNTQEGNSQESFYWSEITMEG